MAFLKDVYAGCVDATKRYLSSGIDLCRYLYNTVVTNRPTKKEVVDTLKHFVDVVKTAPSNYKRHKAEKRHLKKLDEKLKKDYSKQSKDASWIGRLTGAADIATPMMMSVVPYLSMLGAGTLIYITQFLTRTYGNITSKQISDIQSEVSLAEKSKLTRKYIQSQSSDANKFKEQSPKVAEAVSSYMGKDILVQRHKTALIFNAAFLTLLNPISGLLVGGISLYNWMTILHNLRHKKKSQNDTIAAQNQYGIMCDKMIDAAPVLRETNNTDYAEKRIETSQEAALQKAKDFSQNNFNLSMKNVPFNALVAATMWTASLIAGASAGSGFAAAAIFAAAMLSSERVLSSAYTLLQTQAEKIETYRRYKENMKGLEYKKQNVRTGEKTLETSNGHLQTIDMCYIHASGKGVEDISFNFEKGDIHVIAGESGSGKSTIMDLMMHKMDPKDGEILLDGIPLHELSEETILKQIAIISQEPVFLKESIREEMHLFNKEATDEEMQSVLEKVGLKGLSLDRKVFEEGARTLSGGQLQRLAIARALLKESPILLMDEPTSSLDATSKQAVWDTIESLKDEKTIIIVSHDAFEISNADDLTILEEGRITGKGAPIDLMERSHPFIEQVQERIQNSRLDDESNPQKIDFTTETRTNMSENGSFHLPLAFETQTQSTSYSNTESMLMSFMALDVVYRDYCENNVAKEKKNIDEKNHHLAVRNQGKDDR